jgi:hypothetical protein
MRSHLVPHLGDPPSPFAGRAGGPICNSPAREGRDPRACNLLKVRRTGTRPALIALLTALTLIARAPSLLDAQQPTPPTPKPATNDPATQPAKDNRVKVTISKETTYITGPLRPDGYPDYARYFDEKLSEGVTPDNNATVLLLRSLGLGDLPEEQHAEFFKRLGIDPLPAKGDYFVDWATYSRRIPAKEWPAVPADRPPTEKEYYFETLDDVARSKPWKRDEFPAVARWLEAHERQIDLLVAASKRPKMYAPVVIKDPEQSVIAALLPLLQHSRQAARALVARAMYRAGNGEMDKAIEYLMACHRLARLTGEDPTLLSGLVAIAMNQLALNAEQVLIARQALSPKQRSRLRNELDQLSPLPSMADRLDQGERITYLDIVCGMARGISKFVDQGRGDDPSSAIARVLAEQTLGAAIDWNIPLKTGNEWYDRIVKIGRIEDRKEQLQQFDLLKKDIKALEPAANSPKLVVSAILAPRATASQQIAHVLILMLFPATDAAFTAERRNQTNRSLVDLGLSLADYRDEHERFPDRLDQLVPKHLDRVPLDVMWGEPFSYKKTATGYVLYGLGQDGQDDGGSASDTGEGPLDFVIAVPHQKSED